MPDESGTHLDGVFVDGYCQLKSTNDNLTKPIKYSTFQPKAII